MSISDHTSVGSVSGARPELGASGAGTATIPRVRTSRGLSVDVKTSAELPLEDAAALDVLIAERPEVGVFLSRAWLSGFFEEPSPAFEPLLVLFRGDGRLRGIVPIAVRRGFTHSSVRLLGGDYGSDRVDLLAARGFDTACSDAFFRWLRTTFGERLVLQLRDVPADSPLWGAIERANAERIFSLVIEPREIHSLPYLGVANIGHSLRDEADVETLRSLNKHRSWLERRCQPLSIEVLQDSAEIADAFDSLVRFLYLRWQNHPRGSSLSDRRAVRFHHHVLPRLADEGRLRMIRLADCGRTIAVFYGLQAGRWWGYYLCGYDRKWAGRIRLGMIAIASAIDLASADGGVEFDFLKGAERVKYQWPVRTRVTLDADVYSVGSGPQARRATRAARDAVAAMTKSARHLFRSAQLIL